MLIAEHSMCQPGRPGPHGLSQAGSPAFVGLLGPEARRQRIAHELGAAVQGLRSRLHGPVGLDIGAVTPEGIALAIVSGVHAWLAGRQVAWTQHSEP